MMPSPLSSHHPNSGGKHVNHQHTTHCRRYRESADLDRQARSDYCRKRRPCPLRHEELAGQHQNLKRSENVSQSIVQPKNKWGHVPPWGMTPEYMMLFLGFPWIFPVFSRLFHDLSCYEKVKGEISLFRGFVDKLKVFSILLQLLTKYLLSVGIGYVGSIGERFCFCFAV